MVGVLAEAHVADHGEFRRRLLDRAYGPLDDAVVRVSAGSVGVLGLRDAEEHDGRDAQVCNFTTDLDTLIHRQSVHAGHRIHRGTNAFSRADEHGIDQVVHG